MPRPTDAGVFGITRTTAVPCGKCASSPSMRHPAAMETTSVSRPTSVASRGSTASITCGLTATSSTAGGSGSDAKLASTADAAGVELLPDARLRRRLLHEDAPRIEPALEPAGEQRVAHVAGAGEQQGSIEVQGHGPVCLRVARSRGQTLRV